MESPELSIVTDDHVVADNTVMTRRPAVLAQAGVVISTGNQDDAVERALAGAVADPDRLGELLDVLSRGRLWLPLPGDGRPVTDGSAVYLPTVRYLGSAFVPAYTSAARLVRATQELAAGQRVAVLPHAVVRTADLARRLPRALGIALNPGASESVPVYPPGVAYLAAERVTVGGRLVSVGPLPAPPADLLAAIQIRLAGVRAAWQAAAAWLSVERSGEGMVISVALDDPADEAARTAATAAIQDAVTASPRGIGWPIDVTFPGEGEPDVIDRWIDAAAAPFYQRTVGLPAPRPATA
ncbi:MAG TPA: SseB family protein [Streptosporangiaceae bacterium]